jgi:hypothetical protein
MKRYSCATLVLASFAMFGSTAPVSAQDLGKRGGLLLNLDLDFGGDDLAIVSFDDGDTQDVKAGQGIHFGVGGWVRPIEDVPFELQGFLGYKYVTTAATNADIKVTRTTLSLNAVYRFPNGWYVGGGLLRHMNPKLDGDGFFEDIDFDYATGFNAEVGWKWIALHFTDLDYSSDGFQDANAGGIGLRFTWRPGASY